MFVFYNFWEAPRRVSGGSQEAPRRLSEGSQAVIGVGTQTSLVSQLVIQLVGAPLEVQEGILGLML